MLYTFGGGDKMSGKIDSNSETLLTYTLIGNLVLRTNYYMEPFMLKVTEEFKNISYVMKVTKEKERLK